jgi:uncharacterized protein YndB with AHSA1/START domain
MLVRQVVIPVNADQLWKALTETSALAGWFGARVEWDLRPGGEARFLDDDGTTRAGVVIDVRPQRHLRFRWWPEGEPDGVASEVNYDLEPEEDGTRLTVTEEPAPAPQTPVTTSPVQASASLAGTAVAPEAGVWTDWDSRLFGCWAGGEGGRFGFGSEDAGAWTDWDSRRFQCWAGHENRAAAAVGALA